MRLYGSSTAVLRNRVRRKARIPSPEGYHERRWLSGIMESGAVRTTIASSELFGIDPNGEHKRLTLAVGAPKRVDGEAGWQCRVAVVDVLRPTTVSGDDSFVALAAAVERVRAQLAELGAAGWSFSLDSAGREPIDPDAWPVAAAIGET
jgi:hypothetical protein